MKANVKLMNDILNEMKGWILHDDNSLAKNLPKLQARIKDFDKLGIKDDPESKEINQLSSLNSLFCDLEQFHSYFSSLLRACRDLAGTAERIQQIEYQTSLPTWFCNEKERREAYGGNQLAMAASYPCDPVPTKE